MERKIELVGSGTRVYKAKEGEAVPATIGEAKERLSQLWKANGHTKRQARAFFLKDVRRRAGAHIDGQHAEATRRGQLRVLATFEASHPLYQNVARAAAREFPAAADPVAEFVATYGGGR